MAKFCLTLSSVLFCVFHYREFCCSTKPQKSLSLSLVFFKKKRPILLFVEFDSLNLVTPRRCLFEPYLEN